MFAGLTYRSRRCRSAAAFFSVALHIAVISLIILVFPEFALRQPAARQRNAGAYSAPRSKAVRIVLT